MKGLCDLCMPKAFCELEMCAKRLSELCALCERKKSPGWEKNSPATCMSLILSRGCILFLTEEHRRTEHTKAHRDIKSTDITEPYSQQRPHPQPLSEWRREWSPRYPYTISVCSAAYPRIIRMLNTLSLRLRLRSSYNPLVCHSVILSLPVHLLLCLTSPHLSLPVHLLLCLSSPHPSHLSTCYSVFNLPTHPTCPPVTLS